MNKQTANYILLKFIFKYLIPALVIIGLISIVVNKSVSYETAGCAWMILLIFIAVLNYAIFPE